MKLRATGSTSKAKQQSQQPAEPGATPQRSSAELEVAQVVGGSEQTSAEAADEGSPIAQSAGGSLADGHLLTFAMPLVTYLWKRVASQAGWS